MLSRFSAYIDRRLDLLIVAAAEGLNVPEFGRSLDYSFLILKRDLFPMDYKRTYWSGAELNSNILLMKIVRNCNK